MALPARRTRPHAFEATVGSVPSGWPDNCHPRRMSGHYQLIAMSLPWPSGPRAVRQQRCFPVRGDLLRRPDAVRSPVPRSAHIRRPCLMRLTRVAIRRRGGTCPLFAGSSLKITHIIVGHDRLPKAPPALETKGNYRAPGLAIIWIKRLAERAGWVVHGRGGSDRSANLLYHHHGRPGSTVRPAMGRS